MQRAATKARSRASSTRYDDAPQSRTQTLVMPAPVACIPLRGALRCWSRWPGLQREDALSPGHDEPQKIALDIFLI